MDRMTAGTREELGEGGREGGREGEEIREIGRGEGGGRDREKEGFV